MSADWYIALLGVPALLLFSLFASIAIGASARRVPDAPLQTWPIVAVWCGFWMFFGLKVAWGFSLRLSITVAAMTAVVVAYRQRRDDRTSPTGEELTREVETAREAVPPGVDRGTAQRAVRSAIAMSYGQRRGPASSLWRAANTAFAIAACLFACVLVAYAVVFRAFALPLLAGIAAFVFFAVRMWRTRPGAGGA